MISRYRLAYAQRQPSLFFLSQIKPKFKQRLTPIYSILFYSIPLYVFFGERYTPNIDITSDILIHANLFSGKTHLRVGKPIL